MVLDVSDLNDDSDLDSDDDSLRQVVKPKLPPDHSASDRSLAARFIQLVGAEPDRAPKPLRRLHISQLLQMILQDAQTRLFFKAQAVIQSDIRYYAPTADDLDYPARLKGLLHTPSCQHALILWNSRSKGNQTELGGTKKSCLVRRRTFCFATIKGYG